MFGKRRLALTAFMVYAVQLSALAQTSSPSATTGTLPLTIANTVPAVCPVDPGPALLPHTAPVVSEARVISAPIPSMILPKNTDTVTTVNPTPSKKSISTRVPGVLQSPVPAEVAKPITLDQALAIAFQNSPDLRIALDLVERSRGVLNESQAKFSPTFNAAAAYNVQWPSVSLPLGGGVTMPIVAPNSATASTSLLLPLDISHRLGYSSDISLYQFQIQYLSMVAASEKLILNVKSAYYDLLRACGQQDVAKAALDVAMIRMQNTEAKQKAGTVPVFDLMTAQVDAANLAQQLMTAQNSVSNAQSAFNKVLGIDVNAPTQILGTSVAVNMDQIDIPKSTETAYARRPEIKAAQTSITLNKTNIKYQQTSLRPSMNITGAANCNLEASSDNMSYLAGLALSVPLWDGGITKAKVRQARADEQNAVDTLDQSKLGVAQEVRSAALNMQNAAVRTDAGAKVLSLAQEALRLANVRYSAGISVLVEVTNAESQLTQAQINYVNAQYDYATALAQLQRATSSQPELSSLQLLTSPTAASK